MRVVAVCLLISASLIGASSDDEDFRGKWKLNGQRGEIHGLPSAPAELLEITQEGIILRCRADHATVEEIFRTDRKETVNKAGAAVRKSILKWEGAALLFNTLADGPSDDYRYTLMDRWKLSKDGQRLLIHREIIRRTGQVESDLVYERQPETATR